MEGALVVGQAKPTGGRSNKPKISLIYLGLNGKSVVVWPVSCLITG